MAGQPSHAGAPPAGDMALALALAADAREIALRHFRTGLAVERKADATPVTEADREIERRLREALALLNSA
jgi:fructose-1,6-bisphosphatase/inositol monophosphatase family enzyme